MPTEYRVITAALPEQLTYKVNEAIAAGWAPQGGVAATVDNDTGYTIYAQAVVKHAEED